MNLQFIAHLADSNISNLILHIRNLKFQFVVGEMHCIYRYNVSSQLLIIAPTQFLNYCIVKKSTLYFVGCVTKEFIYCLEAFADLNTPTTQKEMVRTV